MGLRVIGIVLTICVSAFGKMSLNDLFGDVGEIPLNLFPMIMSHDAGTGEMVEQRDHIVADWAKTQNASLVEQLNCGARSFDYRPSIGHDGAIYPHHSGVVIRKPMKESLLELKKWTAVNSKELVILYLSHFDGEGCVDSVTALLQETGVPFIKDCSQLAMTYSNALSFSKLLSGGHLMAVFDCMDENYDPSIECYGKDFICYDSWPYNTTNVAFEAINTYMQATTSSNPTVSSSNMWMAQAHWQSSAQSVVKGTLHRSSLLLDEERSSLNKQVEIAIRNRAYSYLNVLELDHVCDNGANVLQAIRDIYLTR